VIWSIGCFGRVAEWQTRWLQVPVSFGTWGFKSPFAHQKRLYEPQRKGHDPFRGRGLTAFRGWGRRPNVGWLTATMRREPELARRFFDRFEPVHAVTYFAPEARAALAALGYRGFWMGYFAARSAPLGIVPREVVTAIFYNFAPARVAKALPTAWEIAGPEAALHARQETAVAALRRYGIETDDNVRVAAELAGKAARQAPLDARPLFAANLALPRPEDPLAALWHATTLLREQRGDTHVIALAGAGVSGRESNVLHAAAGRVPRDYIAGTRDYDDTEWRHHEQRLAERGLLDDGGSLTAAGRELKDSIEARTDALSLSALDALTDDEVEALFQALTPITRAVVAGGDVPAMTPMGFRFGELHDGSAHLGSP
jgi:hypothetical protein